MKRLKKMFLPAFVMIIGTGAAFATHASKNQSQQVSHGYYYDADATEIKCIEKDVNCSTVPGTICTWEESPNVFRNLREYNSNTSCGDLMYLPQ